MSSRRYNKDCEQCGEPFVAKREDARYCSNKCRGFASYTKKKKKQIEQEGETFTLEAGGLAPIEDVGETKAQEMTRLRQEWNQIRTGKDQHSLNLFAKGGILKWKTFHDFLRDHVEDKSRYPELFNK